VKLEYSCGCIFNILANEKAQQSEMENLSFEFQIIPDFIFCKKHRDDLLSELIQRRTQQVESRTKAEMDHVQRIRDAIARQQWKLRI